MLAQYNVKEDPERGRASAEQILCEILNFTV